MTSVMPVQSVSWAQKTWILDWTGLDWTGLDWTGLDWTGLDWTMYLMTTCDTDVQNNTEINTENATKYMEWDYKYKTRHAD